MRPESDVDAQTSRLASGIEEIAVGEVFPHMAPRILPVVEDL